MVHVQMVTVYFLKKMWLVFIWKRTCSCIVGWISHLTSTGGLRDWKEIFWHKWSFWSYTLSTTQILWYVLLWTIGGQKKEIIIFYKGCGHDQNKCYCVATQICHWLSRNKSCSNNFNHDNNNNFLLEGDGHHKNDIVKFVAKHKLLRVSEELICYYPEMKIVHNIEVVVSLTRNFLSFGGIENNYYIETVNYWKIKYL